MTLTQTILSHVQEIAEAHAADPFFADEQIPASMTFIEGLWWWWKDTRIVVPNSPDTRHLIH